MLNNSELQEWTEKYPDFFRGIYRKGIYYYAGRLPVINMVIHKLAYSRHCPKTGWNLRQWLVYFIVREQYKEGYELIQKNELHFSRIKGYSALINDLKNSEEQFLLSQKRSIEEVKDRLNIRQILGENYKPRYKVRIAHSIPHFWNSIQTIAETLCQREELGVEVILSTPDKIDLEKMKRQMENGHYKYLCSDEYKVEIDKPDIVIFNVAHTDTYFSLWGGSDKIRQNAVYIAVVPYDNAVKFESAFWADQYYNLVKKLRADIFIVAKPVYECIKDQYTNTIQMDSPKFDLIHRKLTSERNIPEIWSKLSGKKVVLWTTVHGHDAKDINKFFKGVSFDIYVKEVLDYFRDHSAMGLIFRPHPEYIRELVEQHEIWTKEDLQYLKDFFQQSDNMVWDDSQDYSDAFTVSDALITDDGTGITLSYLPTRKPVCILRRNREEVFTGTRDVTQNYYVAHDFTELELFFEMVGRSEDSLFGKRMETVEKFIPVFDGRNGTRIADKILEDFHNRYGDQKGNRALICEKDRGVG